MRIAEFSNPLVPIDEIIDFYDLEKKKSEERPYVWSNSIQTLDGVLSFKGQHLSISNLGFKHIPELCQYQQTDWRLLNAGWAYSDAILITGQILRDEENGEYKIEFQDLLDFRAAQGKDKHPILCILSVGCEFPFTRPIFQQKGRKVIILTTKEGRLNFEKHKVSSDVLILEFEMVEGKIDLENVLKRLSDFGIDHLDVSAGGVVIKTLIDHCLLDEIRITFAGHIAGPFDCYGNKRPVLFPEGKSYSPQNNPLVAWKKIRCLGDHMMFTRGFLIYRE
jgi:riboflavin biosynthesis pyrimidine reductase